MKILTDSNFIQLFPFIETYRRQKSQVQCDILKFGHTLKSNERAEDKNEGLFFIKATKINLPKSEIKIFKNVENALIFLNSL